jgi:hypothetical protein
MGAQSGCMWSSFLQALRRIEGSRSRFSQAAREAPRPKRRSPGTGNQVSLREFRDFLLVDQRAL